jgi:gliding motility-associated lipoprotein GldK
LFPFRYKIIKEINMKHAAFKLLTCVAMLTAMSCGKSGYQGQLMGSLNRPKYSPPSAYGMVYVPSGTLHIGQSDQDVNYAFNTKSKSISVQGFYMDATEITNNEYRQFVEWVRDSVAHTIIGDFKDNPDGTQQLDWAKKLDWKDQGTQENLESMYYSPDERIFGRKEFDVSKFVYHWEKLDHKAAAQRVNRGKARQSFIRKGDTPIYPDTLAWIHDFSYSYNEPMTRNYFWHPAFDNYPVVGVNWKQADAFCVWRSRYWQTFREGKKLIPEDDFRLPIEAEWEYAARGGKQQSPYPWGGPYTRNKKGCILMNFKPGRGNYPEDGGFYTVRADAYWPNDYGLYNMAGNVAEWTSSAFYENGYHFSHDLNPDIRYDAKESDSETMKRKVTRGGSWKDIAYFCQNGTRNYEYQDTAKCYVGFRCVLSFLGRSMSDFKTRGRKK